MAKKKTSGQIENEIRLKKSEIVITDFSKCYYCKSTGLNESDKFCPNCGFPQRGSQANMKNFLLNIQKQKKLIDEQKAATSKARNILFILSGFNYIAAIAMYFLNNKDIGLLIVISILATIYLSLGIWSKKKPFPAILSAFFVYITVLVISGILDPSNLLKGAILKIIIISGFYYGYKGAKESVRLEKELKSLKESKDLSALDDLQ